MNQLDFILWLQSFRSPVQMGAALRMITGCALERRYVRFPVHMPLGKQVVKVAIGLAVLVVLQMLLPRLFPVGPAFRFARYALIGLWGTLGAPWVFGLVLGTQGNAPHHA